MKIKRKRQLFAIILTAFFALSLILSLSFITAETHHDCTGEECVICAEIETAGDIIKSFGLAAVALSAVAAVKKYVITALTGFIKREEVSVTPVTLKVKISD